MASRKRQTQPERKVEPVHVPRKEPKETPKPVKTPDKVPA